MRLGLVTTPNAVVFVLHFSVGNSPTKSATQINASAASALGSFLISRFQTKALAGTQISNTIAGTTQ
jgi:hypothetical protein